MENQRQSSLAMIDVEQYTLSCVLGDGGYGKVYGATRKSDSLSVAFKIIEDFQGNMDEELDEPLPMEVSLMLKLAHIQGVVKLIDYSLQDKELIIVMERVENSMDLRALFDEESFTPELAKFLFQQLVKTVAECHAAGVVHRDIKPENIIVDLDTNQIKLIDFGSATYFKQSYDNFSGTAEYQPPEFFRDQQCDAVASEVWALGLTLLEMFSGRLPYYHSIKQLSMLRNEHIIIPSDTPTLCQNLIRDMLKVDWMERISLGDVLCHPYVTSSSEAFRPYQLFGSPDMFELWRFQLNMRISPCL